MSESSSSGASGSSSFIPDYSQAGLLTQIAQYANQLAQQQASWAQQTYATTSAITDQNIAQYLTAADAAGGLAINNIDRYENIFQPEENQLVADADSYNSSPRIAQNMGAAESDAAQAANGNRLSAEDNLRSFGVDPSSGRYADLEEAQRSQAAATEAGAGNQAEENTENVGRQLREQAIQVGQQYPGQAVNALNSELQGVAGAEGAALGNANTGVALTTSPNQFLQTASSLKYPPLGTASGSSQRSQSQGNPNQGQGQRSSQQGSGNDPTNPGIPGYDYLINNKSPMPQGGNHPPDGPQNTPDGPQNTPGAIDPMSPFDNVNTGWENYGAPAGASTFSNPSDSGSSGNPANAYNYGGVDNGFDANNPTPGYDPFQFGGSNSAGQSGAPWADNSVGGVGGFGDPYAGAGGGGTYTPPDTSGSTYSAPDTSNYGDDTTGGSSYDPTSGGDGSDSDYAAGGAIPMGGPSAAPTTGGGIPFSASPSQGAQTDDIKANVNAGEFIIPRDVAMWKGQEFFQKLIAQSRKARVTAPAKGKPATPGQNAGQPTTFASRPAPRPAMRPTQPMQRPQRQAMG